MLFSITAHSGTVVQKPVKYLELIQEKRVILESGFEDNIRKSNF